MIAGSVVLSAIMAAAAAIPPAPPPPPPPPPTPAEQCRQAFDEVTRRLPVPELTYVTCPATDAQTTRNGVRYDGYAWFYTPPHPSWVFVNERALARGAAWARYVAAHEMCHVHLWHTTRSSLEPETDACAARVGFPRPREAGPHHRPRA